MKRTITYFFALLFLATPALAHDPALHKGAKVEGSIKSIRVNELQLTTEQGLVVAHLSPSTKYELANDDAAVRDTLKEGQHVVIFGHKLETGALGATEVIIYEIWKLLILRMTTMASSRMQKCVVAFAAIVVVVGGGLLYLRVRGLSARAKPTAIEEWAARRVRDLATPTSVKRRTNPIQPSELIMAEARDHFADHCAVCHGNRGDGKTMVGEGMFPPPPDLRREPTQSLTDGEIFNIIQNGIRFTGMPGFGGSDEDNWKLTLFIRHLPKLSAREEELMKEINHLNEEAHG